MVNIHVNVKTESPERTERIESPESLESNNQNTKGILIIKH